VPLPPAATPASASVEYPPPYTPPPAASQPLPPPYSGSSSDPLLAPEPYNSPRERKPKYERKSFFGEWFGEWGGNGPEGRCFESDHCFDGFISPVSNPFLFEDPRSLTEFRPLFFYQTIPGSTPVLNGGNAGFYGAQFRLALTERWSVVINKLGGVWISPGSDSPLPNETGFAELWLGPKFTFIRNLESGTVAAGGLTFQIPTGPSTVFQNTGKLSLTPYLTGAQNFGCTRFGSFNVMDTLGFTLRTDGQRSNYFFNSFHLDFDVGNLHRVYPLVELNWFSYTQSGTVNDFNVEGRDLANLGSTGVAGQNNLTIATGLRYKFSENFQTGLALEFPLTGNKELMNFRLGIDLIFRY
jgi:hypothetical protein